MQGFESLHQRLALISALAQPFPHLLSSQRDFVTKRPQFVRNPISSRSRLRIGGLRPRLFVRPSLSFSVPVPDAAGTIADTNRQK